MGEEEKRKGGQGKEERGQPAVVKEVTFVDPMALLEWMT